MEFTRHKDKLLDNVVRSKELRNEVSWLEKKNKQTFYAPLAMTINTQKQVGKDILKEHVLQGMEHLILS